MNSHIKIVLFFCLFIVGCKSEGIFDDFSQPPTESKLYEISIKPKDIDIYFSKQIFAIGKYDDGTEVNITSSVIWDVSDEYIAVSDSSGYILPKNIGSTTVIASLDGIISENANINVVSSLVCGHDIGSEIITAIDDSDLNNSATSCLKIAKDNNGKWFTSTPSINILNLLGYVKADGANGTYKTYADLYHEDGTYGPYGDFGLFDQLGGDSLGNDGQYDRWCQNLAAIKFANRDNWRRGSQEELSQLFLDKGDMLNNYGWPSSKYNLYWSLTPTGLSFKTIRLYDGLIGMASTYASMYSSCISEF